MMTFEIVATGIGHTFLASNMFKNNPNVVERVIDILKPIDGRNNTRFSVLFNAFTEVKIGVALQYYKPAFYTIHSDSGGLQMVTLGKQMTPELYKKVYQTQARYSDIAMSFDEIPVVMPDDKSSFHDVKSRFFDVSKVDEYARKSGRNIVDQIHTFLDEKSKTKPFLIAHGNCRETYIRWVETILDEIPSHLHKYIGGISISGIALGAGTLEDIQKAYYAKDFLEYNNHIHLLGVGTVSRIMPFLILENTGYYGKDIHLSYDSTTQTSGITRATSHYKGVEDKIGRLFNAKYEKKFKDVNKLVDLPKYGIDIETFYKTMRDKNTKYLLNEDKTFNEEKVLKFATVIMGWLSSSIYDITYHLDHFSKSLPDALHFSENAGIAQEMVAISNIKNIEVFENWAKSHRHVVKSKKVRHHTRNGTLEGLI